MHRNREILIVEYFQTRGTRWEIFLQRNFSQYLENASSPKLSIEGKNILKVGIDIGADGMIRHWKNWSVWIEWEQVRYEYPSNIQVISK